MTPQILVEQNSFAIELHGYGQVAKALLPRLQQNNFPIASIYNSRGLLASSDNSRQRRVLVDATAPRYEGPHAEAWIRFLEEQLANGTDVVTCNKAPLALAWGRLVAAAKRGGSTISASATVGGGTPVLHFLRRLQASHGVLRIEATLSGTLGFVLSRLSQGVALPEAVRQAQLAGYAEPDPTLDLDGTDAYAKAVILHNRLFEDAPPQTLADRGEKLQIDEALVRDLVDQRFDPQVVAEVAPGSIRLGVVGREPASSIPAPPAHVTVQAYCRDGANISIVGPGAGPAVTAGAILGDLLSLRERPRGTVTVLP